MREVEMALFTIPVVVVISYVFLRAMAKAPAVIQFFMGLAIAAGLVTAVLVANYLVVWAPK